MFEIPENDGFWDDFPLEEVVSPGISTNLSTSGKSKSNGLSIQHDKESCSDSKRKSNFDAGPTTKSMSDVGTVHRSKTERKFPGPAGLLPLSPADGKFSVSVADLPGLSLTSTHKDPNKDEICSLPPSQPQSEDVCSFPQWRQMAEDLGDDSHSLLHKFSIKALLLRASRKMLHKGKAPLVFGILDHLDMQGSEASFVIRDETGKMKGSLHKDLTQDPSTALQTGCVLILRQVSVISPSTRTHYLNVTPANIVYLYSPTQESKVVKKSWSPPPTLLPDSSPSVYDSLQSPSLQEIIEESERELTASLKNFHDRNSRGHTFTRGATSNRGLGHMRPGHNLGSPSLFSLSSSHTAVSTRGMTRPGLQSMNLRPSGNLQRPPIPGFAGYRRGVVPPATSLSESPVPLSTGPRLTEGFKQPLPAAANDIFPTLSHTRNHMISGEVAVRQSSNHPAQSRGYVGLTNLRATNPDNPPLNMSENEACYFDFPEDNVDGELLQLCDETLTNIEQNSKNGLTFSQCDSPNLFKLKCQSEKAISHGAKNSVISKMFQECFQENKDVNDNVHQSNISKTYSETSISINSTPSKKFTFKRSSTSSPALSNAIAPKRKCVVDLPSPSFENSTSFNMVPGLSALQGTAQVDMALIYEPEARQSTVTSTGQRDAKVQLGQARPSCQVDTLTHWEDDLTDDLLLSQLSEDF